ncbi:MAG: molybdopterin-dependent oxidoreductase, partial [Pseudomonadota bacterium]
TGDGRLPPGQRVTEKFPVMTAGAPQPAPVESWTLELAVEAADGAVSPLARWDHDAVRALPMIEVRADIHCVTRWSKLDTVWRGVSFDALLAAAGDPPPEDPDWPRAYVHAEADGGYAANLRLEDLRGESGAGDGAIVALEYDGRPLETDHGAPARLLVPKLYLWKSAKWLRRLTLSPFDRKGYWEKLGYHNYGDPWREQRYRGVSDADARRTLDPELSRKIREERLGARRRGGGTGDGETGGGTPPPR